MNTFRRKLSVNSPRNMPKELFSDINPTNLPKESFIGEKIEHSSRKLSIEVKSAKTSNNLLVPKINLEKISTESTTKSTDDSLEKNSLNLLEIFIDALEDRLIDTIYTKSKSTHPDINLITFYWNECTLILDIITTQNKCSLVGPSISQMYVFNDVNVLDIANIIIRDIMKKL